MPTTTPFCPELGRPWAVGDRVVVTADKAPACRSGVIRAAHSGRVLVFHDEPSDLELFGFPRLFGWSWNEITPEPN